MSMKLLMYWLGPGLHLHKGRRCDPNLKKNRAVYHAALAHVAFLNMLRCGDLGGYLVFVRPVLGP